MPTRYPGFPNATHYTPHVTREEADCHCGCATPAALLPNLLETCHQFEQWRAFHGGPLGIDCLYRCPPQNAKVGGKPNSAHLRAMAIDVAAPEQTAASVDALAAKAEGVKALHDGGIGKYYNEHGFFVHGDWWHDPAYRPARWEER